MQGRLDAIDVNKAVDFVMSCMNFDGGFGSRPGSESHAGLIYCCVGFLSITGKKPLNIVTKYLDAIETILDNIR